MQERLGKDAALVLRHLLATGHATVKQLYQQCKAHAYQAITVQNATSFDEATKGFGDLPCQGSSENDRGQRQFTELQEVVKSLARSDHIMRVRHAHFLSSFDNIKEAERQIMAVDDLAKTKLKKGPEDVRERTHQELDRRNDARILMWESANSSKKVLKRPTTDPSDGASVKKRPKTTSSLPIPLKRAEPDYFTSRGDLAVSLLIPRSFYITYSLQDDLVLRVNHDKSVTLFRNRCLVKAAKQRVGKKAAIIFEDVLKQFERSYYRVFKLTEAAQEGEERLDGPQEIDLNSLLMAANARDTDNLDCERYAYDASADGDGAPRMVELNADGLASGVNGHTNGASHVDETGPVTTDLVETQLRILAQEPYNFVLQDPISCKWQIDFRQLSTQLRNDEVLRLVQQRFSTPGLRIVRILRAKGKLDEKLLQEISLLSARDLRQTLAKLKMAGFLELQEVPREPQRQPTRTMYLWFYDADRVRRALLEDLFKTMTRLLMRMKVERQRIKSTLDKAERSDVKGKESKLMSGAELNVLKVWRRKEDWIVGELMRLDDSVTILKDLG